MSGNASEGPESLESQLTGLDATVHLTGLGPEVDERLSMYYEMPEGSMATSMGGDLAFDFSQSGARMCVRPVAVYGSALLVLDMTAPRSIKNDNRYYLFRGSMYFPDGELEEHGEQALVNTAAAVISQGAQKVGKTADGVIFAYDPKTFCRGAQLAYSDAYPVERLTRKAMRTRSAISSIVGMLITVQPTPNTPLTLFVERDYQLTPRIKNIDHTVGGDTHKLLSFKK